MALHNFLAVVTLSKVYLFAITPNPCSAKHLYKLVRSSGTVFVCPSRFQYVLWVLNYLSPLSSLYVTEISTALLFAYIFFINVALFSRIQTGTHLLELLKVFTCTLHCILRKYSDSPTSQLLGPSLCIRHSRVIILFISTLLKGSKVNWHCPTGNHIFSSTEHLKPYIVLLNNFINIK